MESMSYIRVTKGVSDKGQLLSIGETPIINKDSDYYTSLYEYISFNIFICYACIYLSKGEGF